MVVQYSDSSELDAITLFTSLTLTIYLLITHTINACRSRQYAKLSQAESSNEGLSRSTSRTATNMHSRKERTCKICKCSIESILIIAFIILNIWYFIIKYTVHLGGYRYFGCTTITALYLSVMATSIWSVELFFLVRGWRIFRQMDIGMIGMSDSTFNIFSMICRFGMVFVVFCSISTVGLVSKFVEYEEENGLCVPTQRFKREIMISAFSLMVCAVLTGVMGLIAFATPLVCYQKALKLRMHTAQYMEKRNRWRKVLRNQLFRVVVSMAVVHGMCCSIQIVVNSV